LGTSLSTSGLLLAKVLATVWLLSIAWVDARTGTIPNRLTLPALIPVGLWRVLDGLATLAKLKWLQGLSAGTRSIPMLLFMALTWALCFALWDLHIIGGGDAKTLMGIFGLFPVADFAMTLALSILILSLPLLALRLPRIARTLKTRWRQRQLLPSEQQLREEGRPYAWTFCLPTVAYLWLFW
jgi:Flp pilus assembly protein protease CpaA